MSQNFSSNPATHSANHPHTHLPQPAESASPTPPATLPPSHPSTHSPIHPHTRPDRDPVRILVIGTPPSINAICHSLHVKGFARLDEWSPLLPHDRDRYCRILTRQVHLP